MFNAGDVILFSRIAGLPLQAVSGAVVLLATLSVARADPGAAGSPGYYQPPVVDFRAPPPWPERPQPPERAPLGITASLGFRSDLVHSGGLDAFSTTDVVPESALVVGYRWGDDQTSGAGVDLEWDHGGTSARARNANADLTVDRLSLGIEARVPLSRRWGAFARLAPGLLRHHVAVNDASAAPPPFVGFGAATLRQTTWVAAGDLSGGLAFRVAELHTPTYRPFAFWVLAEGGYGYSGAQDLVLGAPSDPAAGRTDEPLRLGQLAFRGGFIRMRVALSF